MEGLYRPKQDWRTYILNALLKVAGGSNGRYLAADLGLRG